MPPLLPRDICMLLQLSLVDVHSQLARLPSPGFLILTAFPSWSSILAEIKQSAFLLFLSAPLPGTAPGFLDLLHRLQSAADLGLRAQTAALAHPRPVLHSLCPSDSGSRIWGVSWSASKFGFSSSLEEVLMSIK